jgi:hypothetical protein
MVQPHLVVDISAHGPGHLARVAPVLELLARRLLLTVRSRLSREQLARRLAPYLGAAQHSLATHCQPS